MTNESQTTVFAPSAAARGDVFWMEQATALRGRLADKGADFIKTATLEQIEATAGAEFAGQGENTKQSIIDVMRRADEYAALRLTPEEVSKIRGKALAQ